MDTKERFLKIVKMVKGIEISDFDDSIFSSKYDLAPNEIAYILLLASKEIGFRITDEFIDRIETRHSFAEIVKAIEGV